MKKLKQIWKFSLSRGLGTVVISMPKGALLLKVEDQGGESCLWAEVDPEAEVENRTFTTIGTGHPFDPSGKVYIGTFQQLPYVWHIYEEV